MTYKRIHIEFTDYLGIKKTTELNEDQIKNFVTGKPKQEVVKRLDNACKHYSKKYWVSGFINDKKVCSYQWAEL